MNQKTEKIGSYVCSLIDILGQKEKLIKLNGMDLKQNEDFALQIFRETYGIVKKFRQYTSQSIEFVNEIKNKKGLKNNFTSNPIESSSFSDLISNYVLLGDNEHKLQFEGIYFLLISHCEVFLKMLADGVALRGGIDVGMAIKTEKDELYGNALSSPYILECKVAKSIRIVIGQELYDYIDLVSQQEVEEPRTSNHYNIKYAKLCRKLITQDIDGEYILDYLSDEFKSMETFKIYSKRAKEFLQKSYIELKINYQLEIAKKYSQSIKYFERNGI